MIHSSTVHCIPRSRQRLPQAESCDPRPGSHLMGGGQLEVTEREGRADWSEAGVGRK